MTTPKIRGLGPVIVVCWCPDFDGFYRFGDIAPAKAFCEGIEKVVGHRAITLDGRQGRELRELPEHAETWKFVQEKLGEAGLLGQVKGT